MSETTGQTAFDVESVRKEFPIFGHLLPKGVRLAYLDSGASSQKPQVVIDKQREVYEHYFANAYRGVYRFGARVDEEMESSRDRIRGFIGADSVEEVVFTAGTTMSLNVIAYGLCEAFVEPGDEIVLNESEHHANLVPWQMAARKTGAVLRYLPLTPDGQLDQERFDEFITPRTRVVSVAGMSNVLGTIHPIEELAQRAHAVGAHVVVDAAQSAPHMPIDVVAQNIDFLAFSGHKLFGPTAIGVLYGRRDLLDVMPPLLGGGHMIETVTTEGFTCAPPPAKFEAGTLPIVEAIALGEAGILEKYDVELIGADLEAINRGEDRARRRTAGLCLVTDARSSRNDDLRPRAGTSRTHSQLHSAGSSSGGSGAATGSQGSLREARTSLHDATASASGCSSDGACESRDVQQSGRH